MVSCSNPMNQLAHYLQNRRAAILHAWQLRTEADPTLSTSSQLKRSEFLDGIPHWLGALNARLSVLVKEAPSEGEPAGGAEAEHVREEGREHGSHRWYQGYNLREVTREWGHLHHVLSEEIELYRLAHPTCAPELLHQARQAVAEAINDSVNESVAQFHEMQESEAVTHLHDLEQALTDMNELERLRGETLRAASHDVRGTLTVAAGASQMLNEVRDENARAQVIGMVQRSIGALHQMVTALLDLARLEAGQEQRKVAPMDAAALLRQLCESSQPIATGRQLTLTASGPDSLPVVGDSLKVQRIAQNLVLNALKYTTHGSVQVHWDWHGDEEWQLTIQDSGPGISAAVASALTTSDQPDQETSQATPPPSAPATDAGADNILRYSEGIGLSIVKRLCELLDAAVTVETQPASGTTFCIFFPRTYAS